MPLRSATRETREAPSPLYRHPMALTLTALTDEVAARYVRLDLPSWTDPHADREPATEGYSRVTDAPRYRIAQVRARLWADVLAVVVGAEVSEVAPVARDVDRPRWIDRGSRLTSPVPGTLPLFLLERDVPQDDGAPLPVLDVAVTHPDTVVADHPDCGCDACDSGSRDLLEAVDSSIRQVVGGPFVVLRHRGWTAHWGPEGAGLAGEVDADEVWGLCRALAAGQSPTLPRGTAAFVGTSWLR